jgi:hypothetical protein
VDEHASDGEPASLQAFGVLLTVGRIPAGYKRSRSGMLSPCCLLPFPGCLGNMKCSRDNNVTSPNDSRYPD